LIVTYGVRMLSDLEASGAELHFSHEHKALGRFPIDAIAELRMPEGYRRSIRAWANRCGL
jgi:hypothetical protein